MAFMYADTLFLWWKSGLKYAKMRDYHEHVSNKDGKLTLAIATVVR